MRWIMNLLVLCFSMFTPFPNPQSHASGSVIGNGGDPIFEYLEVARAAMVETIKIIVNNPQKLEAFCVLDGLTDGEIDFCRNFFSAVAKGIKRFLWFYEMSDSM